MSLDPTVVMALAAVVAALGGYGLYLKHQIRRSDRRLAEFEAERNRTPPTTTR